jgi:hypothetical protein
MRPSQKAAVGERSGTPALHVEIGVGHANHENAGWPQDALRLGERGARSDELFEAVPDEHGVERLALEPTLLETKRTHIEAERPRETRRVAADVHTDGVPAPLTGGRQKAAGVASDFRHPRTAAQKRSIAGLLLPKGEGMNGMKRFEDGTFVAIIAKCVVVRRVVANENAARVASQNVCRSPQQHRGEIA